MPNLDKEIEVALARVERLKEKKRVAEAIMYAHFGKPADVKQSHAATWRSDFRTPYDAIMSIESMLRGTGRKNQALMVIRLFSKDELDPRDPMTPMIVADAAYALAKEVALSSPCDAVVHLDSDGGNPHAHITIVARENGRAHWVLKKANDKISERWDCRSWSLTHSLTT